LRSSLRRCLAQQLPLLDRPEVTFGKMAFEDRDTAAPQGFAVRVVQARLGKQANIDG